MTKTTKAMLAGAAFAGLFAGTGAAVRASTLLPSLKTSFSAQDQGQDQDQKSDKKVKEKHACKGQNSCKGKGGCKASDNGCKGKIARPTAPSRRRSSSESHAVRCGGPGTIELAFQHSSIPEFDRGAYIRHCFRTWATLEWFCRPEEIYAR